VGTLEFIYTNSRNLIRKQTDKKGPRTDQDRLGLGEASPPSLHLFTTQRPREKCPEDFLQSNKSNNNSCGFELVLRLKLELTLNTEISSQLEPCVLLIRRSRRALYYLKRLFLRPQAGRHPVKKTPQVPYSVCGMSVRCPDVDMPA